MIPANVYLFYFNPIIIAGLWYFIGYKRCKLKVAKKLNEISKRYNPKDGKFKKEDPLEGLTAASRAIGALTVADEILRFLYNDYNPGPKISELTE